MLSGIFGKKSDHPLGDIKSVHALLDDLPRNDTHKSLMDLTGWIESVSANNGFKLDHQFAVLCLLDEAARPYAHELAHYYFTPHEHNHFQEHRLWLALSNFYHHISNAYYQVFNRYCRGDSGGSAIEAQVPLLAARTVHAMIGQLKYICVHYSPIDKTIWANLAQLCQHAEQQQYLDIQLALYSAEAGDTSVKYELAHLLGWQGCGVGTLSPLYIHLTERITRRFRSCMNMSAQQDTSSLFGFDLIHPAAPSRVKATTVHPSTRFVSMAAMQPKLEALIKALEQNIVPQNLNLGGIYSVEVVRKAVHHLLDYLVAPPSRHHPHYRTSGYLSVLYGFAKVVEHANTGPDSSDKQRLRWKIEDISANGFCATLPEQEAGSR